MHGEENWLTALKSNVLVKKGKDKMRQRLRMKAGSILPDGVDVYEGYEEKKGMITANVGIDKIENIMQQFIVMHEEPLFFILELPCKKYDEIVSEDGIIVQRHKDVYYMDDCSQEEALTVLSRTGRILYNDGTSTFGFGGHESKDEILFGRYNVLTIFSKDTCRYEDFFKSHEIEKTDHLETAWQYFTDDAPGISRRYDLNGKSVFDIPEQFKDWGMYFAERREDLPGRQCLCVSSISEVL